MNENIIAKDFINKRISDFDIGKFPIPLESNSLIVFHLIPKVLFETLIDIKQLPCLISNFLDDDIIKNSFRALNINEPLFTPFFESIPTYDKNYGYGFGLLSKLPDSLNNIAYLCLYECGIIEAIDAYLLFSTKEWMRFPALTIENSLINNIPKLLRLFSNFKIQPPFCGFLSFIKIKEYRIWIHKDLNFSSQTTKTGPYINNNLLLPSFETDSYTPDLGKILETTFDYMWKQFKCSRSILYNSQGERKIKFSNRYYSF
jgi:hypothetical protein